MLASSELSFGSMRVIVATLVAPAVVPVVFALAIIMAEPRVTGVSAGLVVGVFSAVFAYATTIVLGLPTYVWLRHSAIGIPTAAWIGAAIGLLVLSLYYVLAQPAPGPLRVLMFFITSAIAGAASGAVFFGIAQPRKSVRVDRLPSET